MTLTPSPKPPGPSQAVKPAQAPQAAKSPSPKPQVNTQLSTRAALVLRQATTANTVSLGLSQTAEATRKELGLGTAMSRKDLVVALTRKVGFGELNRAYRIYAQRSLLKDFAPELTARDVDRTAFHLTPQEQALFLSVMLRQGTQTKYVLDHQVIDNIGKTDNLLSNVLLGTTRTLTKDAGAVKLPGPVDAALTAARKKLGVKSLEVSKIESLSDPKAVQALVTELKAAKAAGTLPALLKAFEQASGMSFYTKIGELIRSPELRRQVLAVLPPPISAAQLSFDAFLENIAVGMIYDAPTSDQLEGENGQAYEDPRRHGQSAPLLAYFGYEAGPMHAGRWGLEMRVFTPKPGNRKYTDAIVVFRGTEGIAFDMASKPRGTVDTLVGDVNPATVGYHQLEQNKEMVDHVIRSAGQAHKLIMTGHSLGGGLAQLAATMFLEQTRTVVTFQGANIDQAAVNRVIEHNRKHPDQAIKARHYRADGDIVPTAGDAALPGEIHYFDAEWQKPGQPFKKGLAGALASSHVIPLLNTYLQGLPTKDPALNLLKVAGIRDETGFKTNRDGKPQTPQTARVTYGGRYSTAKDPRMVLEGGRDGMTAAQTKATRVLSGTGLPNFSFLPDLAYKRMFEQELPVNTVHGHLNGLAKKTRTFKDFTAAALRLLGLHDGTYGELTLTVTEKDRELGTALGVRVPPSVKVGKLTIQDFVLPDELKHRQFHRLQSIWSGLR